MSKLRKFLRSNFRNMCIFKKGRLDNDGKSSKNKTNTVNEEYKEAFRTKSYIEICDKIKTHVETRTNPAREQSKIHKLSDYLLQPQQETLISILNRSSLHPSLSNYMEISQEACKACESLLENVHQVRTNYRAMRKQIKYFEQEPDTSSLRNDRSRLVSKNLALFVLRMKPFSTTMTPKKFHELHDSHVVLLHALTSQCRKAKRRSRFIRCMKRVLASFLLVGLGALAMALLVLALHTIVGLVPVLGLVLSSFYLFLIKKMSRGKGDSDRSTRMGRLGAQLDMAGRGVYIMINDFDTMSQLVQRLQDEMEHIKMVAGICVMRKWRNAAVKVAAEFRVHESCFVEELEDLEKQIYLCLLDINRSRRQVLQELTNREE